MLEWVLTRWPLKLLALLLAFAIWLTVTGENRVIQAFEVPVDLALNDNVALSGPPPTSVEVRLRGPESLVRSINPLRLALRIDLTDAIPGERSILFDGQRLDGVPKGVEVQRIYPDRVAVTLDRRARRVLPIAPSFLGQPPEGYALYDAQVLPDRLEVEGPETLVGAMSGLHTEPILLDDRTESFSTTVSAVPETPEVRVLDPRRPEVRVEIDVAPVRTTVKDVPVTLAGQTFEVNLRPSELSVVLSGPPALLAAIGPTQLQALADVTGLEPDRRAHIVPVRVDLIGLPPRDRARIQVEDVRPSEVSVRISDRRIGG